MKFYPVLPKIAGLSLLSTLAFGSNIMAATDFTANSARDMQSVAGTAAASESEPGVPVPPPSADGQEPGVPAVPPSADGQKPGVAVAPPSTENLEPGLPIQTTDDSNTKADSSGAQAQDTVLVNDVAVTSGVVTSTVADSKSKASRKKGSSKSKQ
jgi:hypothetical protein